MFSSVDRALNIQPMPGGGAGGHHHPGLAGPHDFRSSLNQHQLRSGHFLPGKRTVSGVPPPHGICLGHPAGMGHLGPATRGDRVFVQVAYDFDYVAEDGSQVIMRENEILLLINKTNHDWWQVIRRGDRRPFYAPAKYVVELRPGGVELAAATAEVASSQRAAAFGAAFHAHSHNSLAPPRRLSSPSSNSNQHHIQKGFSTFQSSNGGVQQSKIHPASSHPAPSPSANSAASAAVAALSRRSVPDYTKSVERLDSLDSGPTSRTGKMTATSPSSGSSGSRSGSRSRFLSERYRSNSLDSILVSDHQPNPKPFKEQVVLSGGPQSGTGLLPGTRHSTVGTVLHLHPPQHHLIPKQSQQNLLIGGLGPSSFMPSQGSTGGPTTLTSQHSVDGALISPPNTCNSSSIQKRPTFEGLDKRKSWSVDLNTNIGSISSRHSNGGKVISSPTESLASSTFGGSLSSPAKPGASSGSRESLGPTTKLQGVRQSKPLETTKEEESETVAGKTTMRKSLSSTFTPTDKNVSSPTGGGGVSVSSSSTKLAYQSKQGKQHKSASVAASTPTVGGGVDRLPNSKSDQTNLTASTTAAGVDFKKRKPVPLPRKQLPHPASSAAAATASAKSAGGKKSETPSTVGSGKSTTSSFSSTPKKKASSSAVTTATAAPKPVERPSVASRLFWKRAKTDLGADSLANYKANRASATSVQGVKAPAPRVPTFNRPVVGSSLPPGSVPHTHHQVAILKSGSPLLVTSSSGGSSRSLHSSVNSQHLNNTPSSSGGGGKPKPEVKEKPTFSTFKSSNAKSVNSTAETARSEPLKPSTGPQKKRATLIGRQPISQSEGKSVSSNGRVTKDNADAVSVSSRISVPEDDGLDNRPNNVRVLPSPPFRNDNEYANVSVSCVKKAELNPSTGGVSMSSVASQPPVSPTTVYDPHQKGGGPATSFDHCGPKSEPLLITTEPINLNNTVNCNSSSHHPGTQGGVLHGQSGSSCSETMSTSADKSCSTSFDSNESILSPEESSILTSPPSGGEEGMGGGAASTPADSLSQSSLVLKSPVSTTSRTPPSPNISGMTPLKQVSPDWDEYEEPSSGRKFYYNTLTKEKSWKPPRKSKGNSECGSSSVNHSPQPSTSKASLDATDNGVGDDTTDATNEIVVPNGYERICEGGTGGESGNGADGEFYFQNIFTGEKWYSARDESTGNLYYYECNGNKTEWNLPNVSQTVQDVDNADNDDDGGGVADALDNFAAGVKATVTSGGKPAEGSRTKADSASSCTPDPDDVSELNFRSRTQTQDSLMLEPQPASRRTSTEGGFRRYTLTSPDIKFGGVTLVVHKRGNLYRTKWKENGKSTKKNWDMRHVVLTEKFLMFFKSNREYEKFCKCQKAEAEKAGAGGSKSSSSVMPEITFDLKGSEIGWVRPGKTKKSYAFEVSSGYNLGTTILLHSDTGHKEDIQNAGEWYKEISDVISDLNNQQGAPPPTPVAAMLAGVGGGSLRANDGHPLAIRQNSVDSRTSTLPSKKDSSLPGHKEVKRMRSLRDKMRLMSSSSGELIDTPSGHLTEGGSTTNTPTEEGGGPFVQVKEKQGIKNKLLAFFLRGRPSIDDLFNRGIMKNEPVFGSTLEELQATDLCPVPRFVERCIAEIERGDKIKTDGVYRQGGNICTIQKIRLEVDKGNLSILETMEDVHVLTGALKLFFRELKEPLIPWSCVSKLLLAANAQSKKKRISGMRELVGPKGMSKAHRDTLQCLLRHLVKVASFKDKNRMQFSNLAIVFGPTLMWSPPQEASKTVNLALDLMQQNMIVEALLNNVDAIF